MIAIRDPCFINDPWLLAVRSLLLFALVLLLITFLSGVAPYLDAISTVPCPL
jgi:hypothetical protein